MVFFFLPGWVLKGQDDDICSRLSALVARVGLSWWDCLVGLVILVNVFPTFSGLSAILKGVLGQTYRSCERKENGLPVTLVFSRNINIFGIGLYW
jgi:hypothetical protein